MRNLILLVFILSFTSFTNDNIIDNIELKNSSTLFKMSRNSNRKNLFEQMQNSLKVKPKVNQSNTQNTYTSYREVVEIFGEPNVKINDYILVYTLNPTSGCKAVLEFDSNKTLNYVGIKDCK